MKYRTFLTILGFGMATLLSGQTDTSAQQADEASTPNRDFGLSRAQQTIDAADREAVERQEAIDGMLDADGRMEVPSGDEVFRDLPSASGGSAEAVDEADRISVDFPEEDVRSIIRSVADLYGLNVVIPETLVGRVSIKLRDVTWQQVFSVVLEPMNFTYVIEGNIIKIRSRDEILAEPVDTRVFIINFAQAGELRNSIAPLVEGAVGGRVQVDTRSNALVITERPSRLNSIQQIIEILDRPTEQVMIESKFVEITARDVKNLGVDWQSLSGYSVSAGPFRRDVTDERTREVAGPSPTNTTPDFSRILTHNDTALFSADAFQVVLSALERNTDSRLISNPTIVTVNNTPAEINIGEEYPIPRYTYNQERGTFEVSGFEYKPIGIMLNVTPQINSAGFINMAIRPEISSQTGEVSFGGEGNALIPIITTRKTESTVTIKSGYTLAIGGLIEQVSNTGESSVPLLGNLPVLGKLFRSENKSEDTRNLVIFITARILSGSGATYEDVFSHRRLFDMGIRARDIPGQETTPEEEELYESLRRQSDEHEQMLVEERLRQQLNMIERAKDAEGARIDSEPPYEDRVVRRRYQ